MADYCNLLISYIYICIDYMNSIITYSPNNIQLNYCVLSIWLNYESKLEATMHFVYNFLFSLVGNLC